jgi:hypothetical protein
MTTSSATTSSSTGGQGGAGGSPPSGPFVWPNAASFRTSDPWLVQHHDEINEIHPRLLVINFANGVPLSAVQARYDLQKAAMQEATRFHGYSDPSAKPFMIYELAKLVDLTDNPIPAGWTAPNSTKMPRANGGIDFSALFSQKYADMYAIPDPQNPSHNMTICELLAKGNMQELTIVFNKTGSDANVPEILEYKQVYDANDVKQTGQFDPCAGNGCFQGPDLTAVAVCGQSLRISFLEMTGVIGNSLHVNSHNYEHIGLVALPHFYEMYKPFGNFDLADRFATPFTDWYGPCDYGPMDCITFNGPNSVGWLCDPATSCAGATGVMNPFNQGCGNAHFPPNGRYQYDYYNASPVLATCEHYGLHDGPGGMDLETPYSASTVSQYEAMYGSGVGGGWHIYSFQNFPGYGNHSTLPGGKPMKNFWPYLYY